MVLMMFTSSEIQLKRKRKSNANTFHQFEHKVRQRIIVILMNILLKNFLNFFQILQNTSLFGIFNKIVNIYIS